MVIDLLIGVASIDEDGRNAALAQLLITFLLGRFGPTVGASGAIYGLLLAYAVILGGLPRFLRGPLLTFSGVASNFAGVPLALGFIYTLGTAGIITMMLRDTFGIKLNEAGFNLYTKIGLEIVYLYFQLPLMVLIIALTFFQFRFVERRIHYT